MIKGILRGGLLAVMVALCTAAAVPVAGFAQSSIPSLPVSPSYSGDFPDPAVVWDSSTGLYWAYSTNSGLTNIQVMSSPNLTTWSPIQDALPTLPSWASFGYTWAPSVARFGTTWVMWYTVRDDSSGRECISVATSAAPGGPFTDSTAGPVICQLPDGGSIDPNIFVDGANAYLVWKSDDNAIGQLTHLWAAPLSGGGTTITSTPVQLLSEDAVWQAPSMEGPTMVLNGGVYYLFYGANNWDSPGSAIGYAQCSSPLGPCTDWTTAGPWLQSDGSALGPSGPDVFTDAAGAPQLAYEAWNGCVGYPDCNRALWITPLSFAGGVPQPGPPAPGPLSLLPGAGNNVATGATGSVWVVGTNPVPGGYGICHSTASGCVDVPGGGVAIAVGPDGSPWLVNSAHQIYRGTQFGWVRYPGAATDIAVGANGSLWALGTNPVPGGYGIYSWTGGGWAGVPGAGLAIAVGPDGSAWVVNSGDQIFHRNSSGWLLYPGAATDIAVGTNGSPWIIGTNPVAGGYGIYNWSGGGWAPLSGGGGVSVGPGASGAPAVINSVHQIYAG
jgi:Glycosyl hydrolases family 43/Tectonin domain